ncbi:tetratricopeptide repeat protein [Pseudidiomarina planktonica]
MKIGILLICLVISPVLTGCTSKPPSDVFDLQLAAAYKSYRDGDLTVAEARWRRLVKVDQALTEGWCVLGHISLRQQRYQEALKHYQRCLQLRPEQSEIWHNVAVIRIRQATEALLSGAPYDTHSQDKLLLTKLLKLQRLSAGDF